ncbi:MAG: hypothetical protein ABW199_11900 [Caulobacterales bacterium]
MRFRDFLKWLLSLTVCAGMIGLCVIWWHVWGWAGLVGGAGGFLLRFFERGQRSGEERFGNGYVGALMGLPFGFMAGVLAYYGWQYVTTGALPPSLAAIF